MGAAESQPADDSHGHAHADGSIHHGHSHSHGGAGHAHTTSTAAAPVVARSPLIPGAPSAEQLRAAPTIVAHSQTGYTDRSGIHPVNAQVGNQAAFLNTAPATSAVASATAPIIHADPTTHTLPPQHTTYHQQAQSTAPVSAHTTAAPATGGVATLGSVLRSSPALAPAAAPHAVAHHGPAPVLTSVQLPAQSYTNTVTSSGSSYSSPLVGSSPAIGAVSTYSTPAAAPAASYPAPVAATAPVAIGAVSSYATPAAANAASHPTHAAAGAPVVSGAAFAPTAAHPTQLLPESGTVAPIKQIDIVPTHPLPTTTSGVPMTVTHVQSTAQLPTVRPMEVVEAVGPSHPALSVSVPNTQHSVLATTPAFTVPAASTSVVNPSLLPPTSTLSTASQPSISIAPIPSTVPSTSKPSTRVLTTGTNDVWDQLLRWASPLLPDTSTTNYASQPITALVQALPASEPFRATLQQRQLERKTRRKAQAKENAEAVAQGRKAPPLMSPTSASVPVVRGEGGQSVMIPYEIASVLLSRDKALSAMRLQWVPSRVSEDTFFVEYFTAIVRALGGHVAEREATVTATAPAPAPVPVPIPIQPQLATTGVTISQAVPTSAPAPALASNDVLTSGKPTVMDRVHAIEHNNPPTATTTAGA